MRVLFTISEPCLLRLTVTEDERNGRKAWLLFQAGGSFYARSPTCRWDFFVYIAHVWTFIFCLVSSQVDYIIVILGRYVAYALFFSLKMLYLHIIYNIGNSISAGLTVSCHGMWLGITLFCCGCGPCNVLHLPEYNFYRTELVRDHLRTMERREIVEQIPVT